MLINDIHIFVKFLKNQGQNIYHTPEQIDDAVNAASLDLFRQEEKRFEERQIITDTIGKFKEKFEPVLDDATGKYTLPSDYARATNITGIISDDNVQNPMEDDWEYCDPAIQEALPELEPVEIEVPVDLVEDSDWANRLRDKVEPATLEYPISRIAGGVLEVLPKAVKPVVYYLRYPVKAKWAYTTSGDGYSVIFDEGSSTDLDWPEISRNELIEKTMGYLGVALGQELLIQYEQLQKRNNNE